VSLWSSEVLVVHLNWVFFVELFVFGSIFFYFLMVFVVLMFGIYSSDLLIKKNKYFP
jgi:hypothetical protein